MRCRVCFLAVLLMNWAVGLAFVRPIEAQDGTARVPRAAGAVEPARSVYLGVFTEQPPQALLAQLQDVLPSGEGLVIRRVLPNSPAASSGLEEHDVLADIDGTALTSVEQLRGLIAAHKAGDRVSLRVIRKAQTLTLETALQERPVVGVPRAAAGIQQSLTPGESARLAANRSFSIQSLDGQRFQVVAEYLDDSRQSQRHEFSGTIDDLLSDVRTLPRVLADDISRTLEALKPRGTANQQALRLRVQPRMVGSDQVLRLTIHHPGRQGAVQLFALEHNFGAVAKVEVEQLLQVPELQLQLAQLPDDVRARIEATLRKAQIPQPQLSVLQAQ